MLEQAFLDVVVQVAIHGPRKPLEDGKRQGGGIGEFEIALDL